MSEIYQFSTKIHIISTLPLYNCGTYLQDHSSRYVWNSVVISSGYDSIHRSYNEDGLAETDTYYIGVEPHEKWTAVYS